MKKQKKEVNYYWMYRQFLCKVLMHFYYDWSLHLYENKIGTVVITVTIKLYWPENYRGEERHIF